MNRIWKQDRSWSGVEFCRRDELLPLISSFDFVLDIHSVPDGDFCAGITAPHLAGEISKWCNAPYILLWATEGAVIGPMIGKWGKWFGLEAWNHLSDLSLDRAWENTLRFLQYTAIINVLDNMPVAKQRVFQFKKEILPESNWFLFIEQTEEFHPISPNAIYAIDGTKVLRNLSPGTLFTWIRNEYAKKWKSAGFIFEEVC